MFNLEVQVIQLRIPAFTVNTKKQEFLFPESLSR